MNSGRIERDESNLCREGGQLPENANMVNTDQYGQYIYIYIATHIATNEFTKIANL